MLAAHSEIRSQGHECKYNARRERSTRGEADARPAEAGQRNGVGEIHMNLRALLRMSHSHDTRPGYDEKFSFPIRNLVNFAHGSVRDSQLWQAQYLGDPVDDVSLRPIPYRRLPTFPQTLKGNVSVTPGVVILDESLSPGPLNCAIFGAIFDPMLGSVCDNRP